MKLKYLLCLLFFCLSKLIGQTTTQASQQKGCDGCLYYWKDADGDGWGVLPAIAYSPGKQPLNFILADNQAKKDCDDEDSSITFFICYRDLDGDGYGDSLKPNTSYCSLPSNLYVSNNLDCNDNDKNLNPNTIWYLDNDKDGFGSNTIIAKQCIKPLNGVLNNLDCNDLLASINPNTKWYVDSDNDGFGEPSSSPIISCQKPVGLYINNNADSCPTIAGAIFGCITPVNSCGNSSIYDQNYIITLNPKIGVTSLSSITNVKDINTNISYFDGLGRPIQNATLAQSGTGKDIVTPIEYDALGRQSKQYLPYVPISASSSLYQGNALADLATFYNTTHYENTLNPYSQKEFEASPLNRVIKQAAPGEAWKLGSGHEIKLDYQTNIATEVKYFQVNATFDSAKGLFTNTVIDAGNYAANQLYKTITKDENWTSGDNNTTQEFKDKEGKVVLKRTFNNNAPHDTYYVYDIRNNNTHVIPPLAEGAIAQNVLDGLCYQYKYDYRNRLVEKKLPGKQWEFIVYDKLDRVVATGPAMSPFTDLTGSGWMITKYDAFNRPILTGWMPATITSGARKTLQDSSNAATVLSESKPATATDKIVNGVAFRYSNDVTPTSGFHVLSVNYYDDYNYTNAPTLPATVEGQAVYYNNTVKPKGLPTGSWTRVLEASTLFKNQNSYTLYDYKARAIRTMTLNHLGGYTQVDSKLDFVGKPEYTLTTHKRLSASAVLTIKDMFTYSAQDRLLLHKQKINALPEELIACNTYNELGQLTSKKVGGWDVTGNISLQKVDYSYNIRGWLKGINDTDNLTVVRGDPVDLFSFKLAYNNPTTATPLYNGNISESYWRTGNDNILRKYNYAYDNLNRLLDATYAKPNSVGSQNNYGESLSYDKNGNILSLKRSGGFDSDGLMMPNRIDDLTYSYHPDNQNQLMKVFDSTNSPQGFTDDSDGITDRNGDDYSYDANGNMVKDDNKTITAITYNHLNLPMKIIFANGGTIEYLYSANGQKLQKKVIQGITTPVITEYLDGFQYKDNVLLFFPQAEGYVNVAVVETTCVTCKPARIISSTSFNYVYNYTDHLGNVRLSYGTDPGTGGLRIIEENNYYPFGEKHTNYNSDSRVLVGSVSKSTLRIVPAEFSSYYQYKYNGKELQDELGLNVYDFGARNYMPDLGRWANIDVLTENYMNVSGYNYCLNNPLRFIDPTGMAVEEIEGGVRFTQEDAVSAFNVLTGKSKNAYVEVVGSKKKRDSMNASDRKATNGAWSVFAVKDLGLGAKVLDAFNNSSLDNLLVTNHGGASSTDSYFEYGSDEGDLNEHNSILTSEIASYNAKGGVNLTKDEQDILSFVQMGNKVKNGGNFVFAFCTTGKGDIGQQTLSELKTLLGDRMNIFLPRSLINMRYGDYPTGVGFIANYKLDYTSAGWLRSTPGIKDATNVKSISISSDSARPLIFNK
jgi:RHS repeat-associated protein